MNDYEKKLRKYLDDNRIRAQHLIFNESCHSVAEAAKAANADAQDFVKNICLIDRKDRLIVAIVKGTDRVSTSKVGRVLEVDTPRIAKPEEIESRTGYVCGGVPSFGFEGIFLIDEAAMEKEYVFTGGGSTRSLVKITTEELQKANNATVVKISK